MWRKFVANGLIATAFSPDGKLVAAGQGGETDTGKVHLLDAATGKLVRDVSGHKEGVTDVLFSSDGKHLISVGRDTCVPGLPGGGRQGSRASSGRRAAGSSRTGSAPSPCPRTSGSSPRRTSPASSTCGSSTG